MNYIPGGAIATISIASGGLEVIDSRAQLLPATDMLEQSSLDYYATLRNVSAQRRAALVADGEEGLVAHENYAISPSLPPGALVAEKE